MNTPKTSKDGGYFLVVVVVFVVGNNKSLPEVAVF